MGAGNTVELEGKPHAKDGTCDCYGNENGCPQKRQADYYEKLYHDTLSTLKRTRKMVRALMALLPDELKGKSDDDAQ